MNFELLILFLYSFVRVNSETFYSVDSFDQKIQDNRDIYTNYDNEDEVLRSYKDVYEFPKTRNPRKLDRRISPGNLEETAYMDTMDFHYPEVEFLTKNDNPVLETDYDEFDKQFAYMQSITVTDADRRTTARRHPRLKSRENSTLYEYRPVRLSYVQKIPKPDVKDQTVKYQTVKDHISENSRYEEISTGSSEATQRNTTKEKINNLLKKYFDKLYNEKYNSTDHLNEETSSSLELENFSEDSRGSAETKFINKNALLAAKKKKINKIKKLFSLFQIVQFNNTQCNATSSTVGSYLGVCYTAIECTNLGGTAIGNCASGYGVCCVFKGTCGGTAAQNCSYFESPNYPNFYPSGGGVIIPTTVAPPTTINPSPFPDPRWSWYFYNNKLNKPDEEKARQSLDPALSCIFSVYKISNAVTKIKIDFLDFEAFSVAATLRRTRENRTISVGSRPSDRRKLLQCVLASARHVHFACLHQTCLQLAGPTNGTCTVERLVITGQSQNSIVPTICGYNTGQSNVSQSTGPLRLMVLSTTVFKKRFRFRICQYTTTCFPDNCLQIYDGVTGTISSFNYDQSAMLNRSTPGYFNNLNYAICIRKAPGYCSITYTNVRNAIEYPFNLVNFVNGVSTVPFNRAGVDIIDCPNDYIGIDSTRLCGYKFNDGSVTRNLSLNAAVTDTSSGPIVIPVRTNAALVGYGFKLFYTQNRCTT